MRTRLDSAASDILRDAEERLSALAGGRMFRKPLESVEMRRVAIDGQVEAMNAAMRQGCSSLRQTLAARAGKLSALSPLAVLSRGYAVLYGESGAAVSCAGKIREQEQILVRMHDGDLQCTVNRKEMRKNKGTGAAQNEDQ